jgi:hypothetical protein
VRLPSATRSARAPWTCYFAQCGALVKNGRFTLNEPTDLPEGTVVPLVIVGDWDDLDDAERAELHDAIGEGIEDMEADRTVDAKTAIAKLRSRRRKKKRGP